MATLIKIDKNGSKHFEGTIKCDRCGGQGGADAWKETGWTCYKCGGTGYVYAKWIERTPEYQSKLDARRKARLEKKLAEQEAEQAEQERIRKEAEEARIAEEERIKALKAVSQYVGQAGEKITVKATFDHSAWFETHVGWMTNTMYIHTFKDADGNVIIWKTSKGLGSMNLQDGDTVEITGTVKEHSEYKDEKQTALIRCKITKA